MFRALSESRGVPVAWSWTRKVRCTHSQALERVEYGALAHSLFAILGALLVVLVEAPSFRFWSWPEAWFPQPTSILQTFVFLVGVFYFAVDSYLLIGSRDLPKLLVWGYLFHHAVCAAGLIGPVLTGRDAVISMLGYLLGELSNPPRVFSQLAHVSGDVELSKTFDVLHLGSFLALRALSAKLAFDVFLASSELLSTQLVIISLCGLTVAALAYNWAGQAKPPTAGLPQLPLSLSKTD